MTCSQLSGEELERCIVQDLELRGYGAYIPFSKEIIMESVSCTGSSQDTEVGQNIVRDALGSFEDKAQENFTQNHLPNLSECDLELSDIWECMYAPWGECGFQVFLTVCLSLVIISALILMLTKNKVIPPWLNKTVRQAVTYLRGRRLVNFPSRSSASSSSTGARPRTYSKQLNPRTMFPRMRSAIRKRLRSPSTVNSSHEVLTFLSCY